MCGPPQTSKYKQKTKKNVYLYISFAGFVPQIVPDRVPNLFHFVEVFKLIFVIVLFFVISREGVEPP